VLVSVALPVYDGLPYIKAALQSILVQDIDFEVVVSDDCSRDKTVEVIRELCDPRIHIIENKANVGIYGNLNRCIAAARGEYTQVFSHDDIMRPGYLANQVKYLRKYPQAGFVYGIPDSIDENDALTGSYSNDSTPEYIDRKLYLWIASHYGALPASISSIMIPRRTFETVGLFDPKYAIAGDLEFYNRVSDHFPIVRSPEVLHLVRTHSRMSQKLSSAGPRYLREELKLDLWYRARWSTAEYRKVTSFRAALRGQYHLGWIARSLRRGRIKEAAIGLWQMNKIYPLSSWLISMLNSDLNSHLHPVPQLPAPESID